jgi:hypothetical protein
MGNVHPILDEAALPLSMCIFNGVANSAHIPCLVFKSKVADSNIDYSSLFGHSVGTVSISFGTLHPFSCPA